jgi:hypothetical protein
MDQKIPSLEMMFPNIFPSETVKMIFLGFREMCTSCIFQKFVSGGVGDQLSSWNTP